MLAFLEGGRSGSLVSPWA